MNYNRLKETLGPLVGIIFVGLISAIFFILTSFNRGIESEVKYAEAYERLVIEEINHSTLFYQGELNSIMTSSTFIEAAVRLDNQNEAFEKKILALEDYLGVLLDNDSIIEAFYIHDETHTFEKSISNSNKVLKHNLTTTPWFETELGIMKLSLVEDAGYKLIIDVPILDGGTRTKYAFGLQLDLAGLISHYLNYEDFEVNIISVPNYKLLEGNDDVLLSELVNDYGESVFRNQAIYSRNTDHISISDLNYYKNHIIVSERLNDLTYIVITKPFKKFSIKSISEYFISHLIIFGLMLIAVVVTVLQSGQKTKIWIENDKQFLNEIIEMDKIQISELKKELKFHLDFFNEALIPMIMVDKNSFRIINANQKAIKYYGYKEDELHNMFLTDICRWESGNNKLDEFIAVNHIRKDGSTEDRRVKVQELNFHELEYLVLTILSESSREQDMDSLKMEMFHEIRSPLQGAIGAIEKIDQASDGYSEYIGIAKRSLSNVMMMTNNVLAEGKLLSTADQVLESEFELVGLVNEVVSSAVFQDQHYNMIASDVQENINDVLTTVANYSIKSDPIKLRQILVNLLSNASKYTSDGMVSLNVEIRKNDKKDIVIFRVSDTGVGMSKLEIESMYDAYTTFTTGSTITSTGIGLTITRKYVELLGSTLHVNSEPGLGTTFSFSIEVTPIELPNLLNYQSTSILVVDDDDVSCDYLKHLLEKELDAFVKTTTNETQLLSELNHHEYDCLIIDQNLNHFKGVDMIHLLRNSINKRIAEIPIVLISASKTEHEFKKLSQANPDDILLKPFESKEVVQVLTRVMKPVIHASGPYCDSVDEMVINKEQLCETIDAIGREIFIELVQKFEKNSKEEIITIRTLLEQENYEDAKALIHRLKGSMSYFAPMKCKTLIQKLEFMALNEDPDVFQGLKTFEESHGELLVNLHVIVQNI